jgi:Tfp pilus assembly protein PilF
VRPFYTLCGNGAEGTSFENVVVIYIAAGRPVIVSSFDEDNDMNIVRGFMFGLDREMQKNKFGKMKRLFLLVMLVSFGGLLFSQPVKEKRMPVTTSDKSALSLYKEGMKYFDDVKLDKAIATFKKALELDPDFFMINYNLAFYYLLNRDPDDFEKYGEAAINCKVKLTDGEEILKSVLVRLKNGQTNSTDLGQKLVEMYPNDPGSYNNLINFQSLAGDSVSMIETIKKAITIAANPAPFYNQLGYAYLTMKQLEKAGEAFDKYIELDPKNPNVYDSKGDYYMFAKKYDKAYESYMKAYFMDSSISHDKAEMARQLFEQSEGKRLEIITM